MLRDIFARAACEHRAAFITFLVAGDPSLADTREMIATLQNCGADLIELGVPFSDPIADGPVIADAADRALRNGVCLADILTLASQRRDVPIAVFSYYNPIAQYGVERFAGDANGANVRAVIIPDIALDQVAELAQVFARFGIAMPLFVSPTTSPERLADIAARSTGFIYVVSRLGVTGVERKLELSELGARVRALRALTDLPLAVGFGISSVREFHAVGEFADGVILGSALINAYAKSAGDPARNVREFVKAFAPRPLAV